MHENNINYVLVEKQNKEIVGIIKDSNLIDAVTKNSFEESVKEYVTKINKIQYDADINQLIKKIKKEDYLLVYKKDLFYGIVSHIDVLWYLKKEKVNA